MLLNNKFFHKYVLLLYLLVSVILLRPQTAYALDAYRLAYSNKNGVEVLADTIEGDWCSSVIYLRIIFKNEQIIKSPVFKNLQSKISQVINAKCETAKSADIKGYNKNNHLIFNARASRDNGWVFVMNSSSKTNEDNYTEKELGKSAHSLKINKPRKSIYDYFLVGGWMPLPMDSDIELFERGVYQHSIYTKDKKCFVNYNVKKVSEEVSDWYLDIEKGNCENGRLTGNAKIKIFREDEILEAEGEGFFSDGYFTGKQHWNVRFLQRYAIDDEYQRLNYLLDMDAARSIYFIGYLNSSFDKKYNKYTQWDGCNPMIVSGVTDNESLFLDKSQVNEMVNHIADFVPLFCPDNDTFLFYGAKKPSKVHSIDVPAGINSWKKDDSFLYGVKVTKKDSGEWSFDHSLAKNVMRLKNMEKEAAAERLQDMLTADYKYLAAADKRERLAYLHNVSVIHEPVFIALQGMLANEAVDANFFVHVNKVEVDKLYTDWPYQMVLQSNDMELTKTGWYVISGKMMANDNYLKSPSSKLGSVMVEKATVCKRKYCNEVNNITSLINYRYGL